MPAQKHNKVQDVVTYNQNSGGRKLLANPGKYDTGSTGSASAADAE
ncbi:hypothetical protein [Hahella ganghwensis]|nr:hypothetical protein [Hahella ganghwensis]